MLRKMAARKCIDAFNERSASLLLILLLCADLAFVVLHSINALTPILDHPLLSLKMDQGYPELYGYLKFGWIIILLFCLSLRNWSFHFVAWALVFTYLLLDDALQIHERLGTLVAEQLGFVPAFRLRRKDFGELAVSAAAGLLLLPILVWAYRSGSQMFRKVSQDIIILILVLVCFGVVIDMADIAIRLGKGVGFALGVIEDGGEMIAVSLILWYVFLRTVRDDSADCYLCDLLRIVLARRST